MKFFTYSQTKGDTYKFDAKRGISRFVIIEAGNATDADWRARQIGMWPGSYDVECYGPRWTPAVDAAEYGYPDIAVRQPTVRGTVVQPGAERPTDIPRAWPRAERPHVFIHYADGSQAAAW